METTIKPTTSGVVLALDVGMARIGVARADASIRIASPLTYIQHTDQVAKDIATLIQEHNADTLVVGLPRGLDGQETDQTRSVRAFVAGLKDQLSVPLYWQDEALTSKQAEAELEARGRAFEKGDVDALAACYILTDFLGEQEPQRVV